MLRHSLGRIEAQADALAAIDGAPPEPRFGQIWCPRLDAAALYTLVRTERPQRIVEVGSGHSTRFLWRAVRDEGLETHLTAIDPEPRADLAGLPITLIRDVVQGVDRAPFAALRAGDLLFVELEPRDDAGDGRRLHPEPRHADAAGGRVRGLPRHLPARPVSGRMALHRL